MRLPARLRTQPPIVNDNGQITTATMMWVDTNQDHFMGIIGKYPGVISMSLAGHTHMDEFRLMSPGNALAITAGISPYFGNNPAYKIFKLDGVSLAPIDYSAVNYNLSTTPAAFSDYYTFSQAYELEGPLAASLPELYPALLASNAAKTQYQGAFYFRQQCSQSHQQYELAGLLVRHRIHGRTGVFQCREHVLRFAGARRFFDCAFFPEPASG